MKKCINDLGNNLVITCVSPWNQDRLLISPITKKQNHFQINNSVNTAIYKKYNNKECYAITNIHGGYILFVTSRPIIKEKDKKGGFIVLELAKNLQSIGF